MGGWGKNTHSQTDMQQNPMSLERGIGAFFPAQDEAPLTHREELSADVGILEQECWCQGSPQEGSHQVGTKMKDNLYFLLIIILILRNSKNYCFCYGSKFPNVIAFYESYVGVLTS